MSDMAAYYRDLHDYRRRIREHFGTPCPRCQTEQPKRQPTILLPGARCKVHRPAYVDPRPRLTNEEIGKCLTSNQ